MTRLQKCISKILSVIFVFVALFGIYACVGMSLSMMLPEQMTNTHAAEAISDHCMLVMSQETCSWNIAEHLEHWQNTFVFSLLSDTFGLFAFVLLFLFFFVRFAFSFWRTAGKIYWEEYKQYRRAHREFRLYSHFLKLFSRGILHTKIYA